jgi:ribonucleoside-diphosphate reductase alpha chain
MVESKKLQLLIKKQDSNYDINDTDYFKSNILPYIQTDLFIEEVANLKLKQLPSGKYTTEQVTKKINKDRYSAVSYGLWYIKNFMDSVDETSDEDYMFFMSSGFN